MFIINLGLILASLITLARQFRLSRPNKLALLGVAATFYPVYFVVERGNLDGIMLALVVFGFRSKNRFVQALLLGASVALKVYSGLFLALLVRRRKNWNLVLGAIAVAAMLQLPFLHVLPNFWAAITGRGGDFRPFENISPAVIVWLFAQSLGGWKAIYAVIWAGTLLYRMTRDWDEEIPDTWPVYAPWLISFPTLVYPYTGVFVLALLALLAGECQRRSLLVSEERIVTGAALLGFQGTAWATALAFVGTRALLVHFICAMGTLLIVVGGCGLPNYKMLPRNGAEVV